MNQKEEYEAAKKKYGTVEGVESKWESLFPQNLLVDDAPKLQVERQVAMQTLSIEVAMQVRDGKNPTEIGDKINRLQQALAKVFAKGGQISAMAIWRFMTPEGIVYQVNQKIAERNKQIEERLSPEQKEELSKLTEKVAALEAKLDEEIARSSERRAAKANVAPQKVFSEAKKTRKAELKEILKKKMFGQLNDITNIPRILLDKDTIEYARLVIEEGAVDFNSFSKEMVKDFGAKVKKILPKLFVEATGVDLLDAISKRQIEEFLQKDFAKQYGTSKLPTKTVAKTQLGKLLEGINNGVLTDTFYKSLFLEKFGMAAELSIDETIELQNLAAAVTSLPPTSRLYNLAVMNMAQFINNKYPRNFWENIADTWIAMNYIQMLSGPSTTALNIVSTGSGIMNSPFRNVANLSKWLKALKKGIKDMSMDSFMAYNPIYESYFVPAAWIEGMKEGGNMFANTLMEGATTDKYIEGLANQSGKVTISRVEQDKYGKGKAYKPLRLFGLDLNPYNKAKYVGRFLAAQDAFMFQTTYEAEIAGLALDIYREKGLRGAALIKAVKAAYSKSNVDMVAAKVQLDEEIAAFNLSGKPLSELSKKIRLSEIAIGQSLKELGATVDQQTEIKELAAASTFTDDRNGVISRLAGLIGRIVNYNRGSQFFLKVFVPFTKIVANVTETSLDNSPYGIARANGYGVSGVLNRIMVAFGQEGFATSQMGKVGTRKYYEQMGRAWQGTIAFYVMVMLFASDPDDADDEDNYLQLTGGYNEETKKAKPGREKLTPKYTLRIGTFKLSYLNIPFLQIPLALIGNYNDYLRANRYNDKELNERLALAVASSLPQTVTMVKDMSFMRGVQELTKTIYETIGTEEAKFTTAVKGLYAQYSGFIFRPLPQNNNMILQIENVFDPTKYSRKEVYDITVYSLGVQHLFGHPSVDILGDRVKSFPAEGTIPYTHWFGLVKADKEWQFMIKYNAIQSGIKNEPTMIFNYDLNEYEKRPMEANELYDYTVLAGKIFREKLQNYEAKTDANIRVKEIVRDNPLDKGVNGVDHDLRGLFSEAKTEANEQLFLSKNVGAADLKRSSEIKVKDDKVKELTSNEGKKDDIKDAKEQAQIDITYKVGAEDIKLRESIKIAKNEELFLLSYMNKKGLSKDDKLRFLIRLKAIRTIENPVYQKLKKVINF